VAEKVRHLPAGKGLNAATGEYVDMIGRHHRPGQGDPLALQNAASIAALFLTTEAVIADKPEKAAPAMPAAATTWAAWASEFGFAHVGRLTSELQESDLNTFEKSDAWRAAFIESIRD
jgi:hypothetical protein